MMPKIEIAPSLLSANFAELGAEIKRLEEAGADRLHLDVMDGHYVPNLTFGPPVIKALRPLTTLPFDVHLMIKPVDILLDAFIEAGSDIILFHPDADIHTHRTLQRIKNAGKKAGLVLNPALPIDWVEPVLEDLDQILVMSVNPGFGGQKFITSQLKKIEALRKLVEARRLNIDIEVDGGVTAQNASDIISAGANVLVAGTSVFKGGAKTYQENIASLRR